MNDAAAVSGFHVVDFFCGAGGSSRGLVSAGSRVLAGIDRDPEYRATFVANNGDADGNPAEFLTLDLLPRKAHYPGGQRHEALAEIGRIVEAARAEQRRPLLFVFCPPCQPFTSVNRGKLSSDMEESRKQDKGLLYHSLGYIDHFRPEAVLCENVSGIQDRKFGGVWQHFEAGVAALGYHVASAVVDTADFGIPQVRRRSILIAVRKDVFAGDPSTLDGEGRLVIPTVDTEARRVTAREAIGHLPRLDAGETHPDDPDHRASKVSDINRLRLKAAPEGGTNEHYRGTDLEVGCHSRLRDRMDKDGRRSGGYTDAYTRLYADRPAPTITTKCFSFSNGRFGHYDRGQDRALSIREAACLQSFPEDYRFITPSISAAAKMVGNAVPPKLAEFYARHLMGMVGS
ncbi:DNA cytosine methyltransferase [Pararhizobium sp. BT-229]|uniref:DNA cytosine methyltransferase n=1 Tax=Pararhizobium sp. BT-229 TaxID=2986923 RepID=UPI0021F6FEFF|nr:DNA cytosine methyltransferase [Pararhizobium sp. BT-229]MCV9963912.1 DNA cytosine methyltransferase [Pararhizobium sp. BT-229]